MHRPKFTEESWMVYLEGLGYEPFNGKYYKCNGWVFQLNHIYPNSIYYSLFLDTHKSIVVPVYINYDDTVWKLYLMLEAIADRKRAPLLVGIKSELADKIMEHLLNKVC